jgi:ABC-2 type transport system permease protein
MMNLIAKANWSITAGISAALWVEILKVRRSKTLWITALGFILIALIGGLFMFILKDPDLARRMGLLGAKAQMLGGSADWPSFFNQIMLMESIGGLIMFGFIFVWIFGREFGEKTFYDLLSLPTSRVTIVVAKFITAASWSLVLLILLYLLVLSFGAMLQLPGWSAAAAVNGLEHMLVTGLLTILVVVPFSLVACVTRGYLPAVGSIFLVLVLAQVFNTLGYGLYFPWAIPALYNGIAGEAGALPGLISYLLVIMVGVAGWLVTTLWWQYADQT